MPRVWRGSSEVKEDPESPEYTFRGTEAICVVKFVGEHADLLSNRPAIGAKVNGVEGAFEVDMVKIKKARSGKGLMVVTLHNPSYNPPNTTASSEPKYEVDWPKVQRDLLTHDRYSSSGAKALTFEDLVYIESWKNEQNPTFRAAFQFSPPSGSVLTLSANAQDYATKYLRGQDSYNAYTPVVRETSLTRINDQAQKCGSIASPPAKAKAPSGYTFVKTAHRVTRSGTRGKWEKSVEWTGAEYVDPDIYA